MDAPPSLTRTERLALRAFDVVNGPLKAPTALFQRLVPSSVIAACTGGQVDLVGMRRLRELDPKRSILLCCNHRSFFDQFVVAERLVRLGMRRRFYFPVRAPFFYDRIAGMVINVMLSGGSMYPPIFRDPHKAALNKRALARLGELLRDPRSVVGMHPEGTRGKGPDPYELLPAQPGVGKAWLVARETTQVLPAFILGLSNSVATELLTNVGLEHKPRIVVVFGSPLREDVVAGLASDRPAHQKKAADRILVAVRALMDEEKAVRQWRLRPDLSGGWRRRQVEELLGGSPIFFP